MPSFKVFKDITNSIVVFKYPAGTCIDQRHSEASCGISVIDSFDIFIKKLI